MTLESLIAERDALAEQLRVRPDAGEVPQSEISKNHCTCSASPDDAECDGR